MTESGANHSSGEYEAIEAIGGQARVTPGPSERQRPSLDSAGRIRSGRLAGLSMRQAIWVLSWPILIESVLNSLVGLFDTILAAGISEAATDAIGGASYIMWFLSLIGMAIGIGATALISRSVGGGKMAVANAALGQALLLSTAVGAVVGIALYASTPWIAMLLRLQPEASEALIVYMRIAALGVPLNAAMLTGLACCRAAGDTYRPLWTMLIVNVVNISVSWALAGVDLAVTRLDEAGEPVRRVLLANNLGFDMGILGVAIGTLAAWVVGAVVVIVWLASGASGIKLRAKRLRPHWHTMRRLIRVGMPSFIEAAGMWVGNFMVLLLVGLMQAPGLLGSHIVAIRIEAFAFLPGFSMGMAASTLMGQYLGAGSPAMARKAGGACFLIAATFMALMGAGFMLFPAPIVGLLTQQASHLEMAPKLLFMAGFIQIPFAIDLVLRTGMRGAGDAKAMMLITWAHTYALRLPMAWFFSGVEIPLWGGMTLPNPGPDWGLVGIWVGLLTELVIRSGFVLARFLHGGWARTKV